MTDRQREALASATDLALYGTPREASLGDVDDALGVAGGRSRSYWGGRGALVGRLFEPDDA